MVLVKGERRWKIMYWNCKRMNWLCIDICVEYYFILKILFNETRKVSQKCLIKDTEGVYSSIYGNKKFHKQNLSYCVVRLMGDFYKYK